jgi:hypothetical protein
LQSQSSKTRGWIIFGTIVIIFLIICLAAYIITGNKGIEERFSQAVGLPSEPDAGGDNGFFGFHIEGNILSYVIILALILVACVVIYRKFKI